MMSENSLDGSGHGNLRAACSTRLIEEVVSFPIDLYCFSFFEIRDHHAETHYTCTHPCWR